MIKLRGYHPLWPYFPEEFIQPIKVVTITTSPLRHRKDVQELRSNYDKLRCAYELGRTVGENHNLDSVLEHILEAAFRLLSAERAAILLVDPNTGVPETHIAKKQSGDDATIVLSKTIIDEVMATRVGMILADASQDSRFSTAESVIAEGIRSGRAKEALLVSLAKCGELLERSGVERKPDDRNELSDHLRTRVR